MGTRTRSTLVVEAEHYGVGETVWMFDMSVVRKVVVQQVQVDVGADGKGVAKHLVESVEAFDLEDGSLVRPRRGPGSGPTA